MSNLFKNLKKYAESWQVVSTESFDSEDLDLLTSGEVVKSTYGTSLKMHLKVGGYLYIPIDSRDETYSIGDTVDLTRVVVKTLHKDGEEDIQRIVFKDKPVMANV